MKAVWIIFGALLAAGCSRHMPTSANAVTGSALVRIDTRAESIETNATALKDFTSDVGMPLLGYIGAAARQIRADAAEASEANAHQAKDLRIVTGERDRAMGTVGYRIGEWVKRSLWVIGIVIAVVVALRSFGLVSTGWLGSVASWTATGIVTLATGGLSALQWGFDNLWFRRFKPREPGEVD